MAAPLKFEPPRATLPTGGGAIRSIGEKFAANPVTGTASASVPIATSPGRSGFGPALRLAYDSGAGNGVFGFGWSFDLPAIARKTDRGLPRYHDAAESDVFTRTGDEDFVRVLGPDGQPVSDTATAPGFTIDRYRPRVERAPERVERWTRSDDGDTHWRILSADNVLTVFGKDASSRIADPSAPERVFSWLICERRDDRGNGVVYEYRSEDGAGADLRAPHERNRGDPDAAGRAVNRHLKRVRYGNRIPLLDANGARPALLAPAQLAAADWMFEVVLDYGEHDAVAPTPRDAGTWATRGDAFSSYRAGFEVRTSRLCRRILMFHHFPGEPGVGADCLVRSTDLEYAEAASGYAFVAAVTHCGYTRAAQGYVRRSLPAVEFEYSQAAPQDTVHDVPADSLRHLPVGIDGRSHRLLDLHGEGLPGILTEQGDAWFYTRNLSPLDADTVTFGPAERVAVRPNAVERSRFMDLAGNGRLSLVDLAGPVAGFYEHDEGESWEPFRAFGSHLNRDFDDPNLRMLDLDGDGSADVLLTEDDALVYHRSLGEQGFGPACRIPHALDEERGPRLAFAGAGEMIHLADMSGDGLVDLVRVRAQGELCYWPNLGHGRFGAKVTMDAAPRFDTPDQFDPRRLLLADIDGTGTTDIVFLARDGARLYFNRSGNGWSPATVLRAFPPVDDRSAVTALDLHGNGTASLAWSSPLPRDAGRQLRYIDLIGPRKPHLLTRVVNNLGAETRITYASSTKFYLRDKHAGRPWIAKLPFPVHVVERVETIDAISGNRFTTEYAYHHGHFDRVEREFRGFGMVEQWDSERLPALAEREQAPVHTKTWFDTGEHRHRERVLSAYAAEYHRDAQPLAAPSLPDTLLAADGSRRAHRLRLDEEREACRALRGGVLHQETYVKAEHPYTVLQQTFAVELLQPGGEGRHAVFLAHPHEALQHHYERDPQDPRVAHSLTFAVDAYGNALRTAAIAYGRRRPDPGIEDAGARAEQTRLHVTAAEHRFTNAVDDATAWRTPAPCETRSFELTGIELAPQALRFTTDQLERALERASEIAYEADAAPPALQKRPIEHVRVRYRPDDLGASRNDPEALLALGTLEALALDGESRRLAFTPGLIAAAFGDRVTDAMLESGGYVHSEGDANWWMPSGRTFLSAGPAQELAAAHRHFFLPRRFRDPLHTAAVPIETMVDYDAHDLLLQEHRDALGNRVTCGERDAAGGLAVQGNDYRVLAPRLLMDPNGNRGAVAHDALGMVVGTAVLGKPPPAAPEGDSLEGFDADLDEAVVLAHLADPLAEPRAVLSEATTRTLYDLFAYQRTKASGAPQPVVAYTIARETHDRAPRFQHSLHYSDGFGREIQVKAGAEPGPVPKRDDAGRIVVDADGEPELTATAVQPRWVGSGWTVFNDKGAPVRRFEPFFSDTQRFDDDARIGVSPVHFYDPAGRAIGVLEPDHTWSKVVVRAWRTETWDANDTVLVADPAADPDVGESFARLPREAYLPTWTQRQLALGADAQRAAGEAAVHAATPAIAHSDSLGRIFLTVAHRRARYSDAPVLETFHRTRVRFDIEGNPREVIDERDRVVERSVYDMLGNRVQHSSMEAGARWALGDVTGKPVYAWDSRDHRLRFTHDALHRPVDVLLRTGASAELVVERTGYGEARADADAGNLRGQVVERFDQAGVLTTDAYDFAGNPLGSRRRLAQAYDATLDWSAAVALEAATYTSSTRYDALHRPIQSIPPHAGATVTVTQPVYNDAGLLERLDVWLEHASDLAGRLVEGAPDLPAIASVAYDAQGRRTEIAHGNGATTTFTFDRLTSRLTSLRTRRASGAVQDLTYTYDPVGNITSVHDAAQQTIFFKNRRVEPSAAYTYDALYRLIEATGREHVGQAGRPIPHSYDDAPRIRLAHPGDGNAMARYLERYTYDAAGNFETMSHAGSDPASPGWTRAYAYGEASPLQPGVFSNRLTSTTVAGARETYSTGGDGYDAHGNLLRMPQLEALRWDHHDQLQMTRRQRVDASDGDGELHQGERTFYVYDAAGRRVRKVTELATGALKDQRTYLGDVELYRREGGDPLTRETLHVLAGTQRIALVETRTAGSEAGVPRRLVRYQYGNHLGSSSLELDERAAIVSYEEYTPYGSTSYQAVRSGTETRKRYRQTGEERDEESGLYHHGARYFAAWLGRWTACDPSGIEDGTNLYAYVAGNPIVLSDPTGHAGQPPELLPAYRLVRWLVEEGSGPWKVPLAIKQAQVRLAKASSSKKHRVDPGSLHVGHPPDSPRALTPAGRRIYVRLERARGKGGNLSEGAGWIRKLVTAVKKGLASAIGNRDNPEFYRKNARDPNPAPGAPTKPTLVDKTAAQAEEQLAKTTGKEGGAVAKEGAAIATKQLANKEAQVGLKLGAKALGKKALKLAPGVGIVVGAVLVTKSARAGDWESAAWDAAEAVPVAGDVVAAGHLSLDIGSSDVAAAHGAAVAKAETRVLTFVGVSPEHARQYALVSGGFVAATSAVSVAPIIAVHNKMQKGSEALAAWLKR